MAQFFNHYSFLISAGVVVALTALLLARDGFSRRDGVALVTVIGAFGLAWWLLRPSGTGPTLTLAEVEASVGHGHPALVEFYSDF